MHIHFPVEVYRDTDSCECNEISRRKFVHLGLVKWLKGAINIKIYEVEVGK